MPGGELSGGGRIGGLVVGTAAMAIMLLLPAPVGMPAEAWRVAAVAVLMASWWISEAAPLPATALAPIVLFPLLGIAPLAEAAAPYADPVMFLFLGGFVLGIGLERRSLHKRAGLRAILLVGTSPRRLIGGFLLATATLSMWVSNSATAVIMLPVATAVLGLFASHCRADRVSQRNLGTAVMLAVAYGASIGGLGTLIGTPPNALLAAYMEREHGVTIGFAQWMLIGLPMVFAMIAVTWPLLVRLHPISTAAVDAGPAIRAELDALGPPGPAERRVAAVFVATALAWVTRPLYGTYVPGLDDSVIAVIGALCLFVVPSGQGDGERLIAWEDTRALPWGILVLFGGGLSLAGAISSSGLAAWLGSAMSQLGSLPVLAVLFAATLGMIFLTELTSNTASAATFLPVGGAVALGIGIEPAMLAVPLALAASCAFMLPVATPPNAIVFAGGLVTIGQMARVGLWINLLGAVVIVALSYLFAGILFGR
ncbi:MAG TPA: DASS family sodium-coupled anion symporter [Rhizobiales bacterium]|nr:DASS family sodium-coupled anion symporter [Hyphomicrobiales bacterium]